MFNRVAEFHRIFGINISNFPHLPNQPERDLRIRLLKEEKNEFCDAFENNDLVEMSDGLADMAYIIAGTCVSYGICPEGRFESPYDGVIPQMTMFYNKSLFAIITEDCDRYFSAEQENDFQAIRNSLMQMMVTIFGVSLHLGIPFNKIFTEVHRSNMSKVNKNGRPSFREDGKLLKGDNFSPPDIKTILVQHLNITL